MTIRKLFAFGPKIGRIIMPENVVSELNSITDKTIKSNEDFGYALAGQIKNQKILIAEDLGWVWDWLKEEVSIYITSILKDLDPKFRKKSNTYEDLEVEVSIDSMWTVSQFKNEYNPVHFHAEIKSNEDISGNCQISSVLYLKIPNSISRKIEGKKGAPDGAIEFISSAYGAHLESLSIGSRRFQPTVGHLYVFPSWLLHTVYPFTGKGERRSISFNSTYKLISQTKD